jgi:arylsulfatase A-like enzyme
MPKDEVTIGGLLSKKGGYVTGVLGKWGEGDFGSTGYPLAVGFDEFLGQDSQVGCHKWYPSDGSTAGGSLFNMTAELLLPQKYRCIM